MATVIQRLELRRSAIRERLTAIGGLEGDAYTDEVRSEEAALQAEYGQLEQRHRSAVLVAEPNGQEPPAPEGDAGDGDTLSALEGRVALGSYLSSLVEGRAPDGAEAELQQELGLAADQVPLQALETRAVTPGPAAGSREGHQHMVDTGPYDMGAAAWMGIPRPVVPVGDQVYPALTTGASPGTPAADASQAETTGAFSVTRISPGRVQASFLFRREDAATLKGMEDGLRRDLQSAISEKLDAEVIGGSSGLLGGGLTDPTDNSTAETYASYISTAAGYVDGLWAKGPGDVKQLVGSDTFADMAGLVPSGDGRNAAEKVASMFGGLRVSSHVPAAASNIQPTAYALTGGGVRTAVLPVWGAVTIINDPYSQSKKGQIHLSAVQLFGFSILRSDAFKRVDLKLA